MGIGEIGLNKNSRNELAVFEKHVDLAAKHDKLILIHTPRLEDKLKGTKLIIDALKSGQTNQSPERVIIDHVEEHTIQLVLDAGFWAGMTLYPESKCTAARRAADMVEIYGRGRLWMNSACDWGVSVPLAVPAGRAWKCGSAAILAAEAVDDMIYQSPHQVPQPMPGKFHLSSLK